MCFGCGEVVDLGEVDESGYCGRCRDDDAGDDALATAIAMLPAEPIARGIGIGVLRAMSTLGLI